MNKHMNCKNNQEGKFLSFAYNEITSSSSLSLVSKPSAMNFSSICFLNVKLFCVSFVMVCLQHLTIYINERLFTTHLLTDLHNEFHPVIHLICELTKQC